LAGVWPPVGRFWCFFNYYLLIILISNIVPLISEFAREKPIIGRGGEGMVFS
jgi:hypothetical protein